jgi:hypothetical protein
MKGQWANKAEKSSVSIADWRNLVLSCVKFMTLTAEEGEK